MNNAKAPVTFLERVLFFVLFYRLCHACGVPFRRSGWGRYCSELCVPSYYRRMPRSYAARDGVDVYRRDLDTRAREAGV